MDVRRADDRGRADFGWLQSRHTFSFGQYHDPQQPGFSDLRVINEDVVAPGRGFDPHPHRDMEIFSYVLSGALAHRDSTGSGAVIRPGELQVMSAGTGIVHSEFNPSPDQPVHFLQVWIVPARRGLPPRYEQVRFEDAELRGRLRLLLSPEREAGSLAIHQDVRVHAGRFDGAESARLELPPGRHAYVHVARGALAVDGVRLEAGDGARLRHAQRIAFDGGRDAEVLVFDLRGRELP